MSRDLTYDLVEEFLEYRSKRLIESFFRLYESNLKISPLDRVYRGVKKMYDQETPEIKMEVESLKNQLNIIRRKKTVLGVEEEKKIDQEINNLLRRINQLDELLQIASGYDPKWEKGRKSEFQEKWEEKLKPFSDVGLGVDNDSDDSIRKIKKDFQNQHDDLVKRKRDHSRKVDKERRELENSLKDIELNLRKKEEYLLEGRGIKPIKLNSGFSYYIGGRNTSNVWILLGIVTNENNKISLYSIPKGKITYNPQGGIEIPGIEDQSYRMTLISMIDAKRTINQYGLKVQEDKYSVEGSSSTSRSKTGLDDTLVDDLILGTSSQKSYGEGFKM